MAAKNHDKSNRAIGGGLLAGMGVGFFFLDESALAFVGSMFIGLGMGLVLSPLIANMKTGSSV